MTAEQKRQLELLKELEAIENSEIDEVVVDDLSDYEELQEIETNIIFEEEYKFKVKQNGEFKFIDAKITLSDVDFFTVKDIQKDFANIKDGQVDMHAVDNFFADCVSMFEAGGKVKYKPQTTKEKFMLITALFSKITPSLLQQGNRQQRRAAQRKHTNK